MYLHTIDQPRSKEFFRGRLTALEKIQIRNASEAGLESMIHTHFAADMITIDTLKEVKRDLHAELAEFTARPKWWSQ
jgi:hypothetical protein